MPKAKFYLISLVFLFLPSISWAIEIDALKADFLQGNYRQVIFEAEAQRQGINLGNTDELNYILGLSYLKEGKVSAAQDCFLRILNNPSGKFKGRATLGLADTYLIQSRFPEAQDLYNKLINDDSNTSLKAAVLYRLSQLEFKRNNHQQGNYYLTKLKKDFPLSPELRSNQSLGLIGEISKVTDKVVDGEGGEHCVQVGFFSNSTNASNLKNKLLAKDFPAYVENASGGYRVRVGKFKTQKQALDLEEKLSQEGFPTKLCP